MAHNSRTIKLKKYRRFRADPESPEVTVGILKVC